MAGLASVPAAELTEVSARQQFAAVAWLRWRLFLNGFRRKGSKGELAARLVLLPLGIVFLGGPVVGAGFGAYFAAARGHLGLLYGIFWAIFAYQLIISINIAPPTLAFTPESLIRFPLAFPRYLALRLGLGLLAVSTLVGSGSLLLAALGASLAKPSLTLPAFAAAGLLALSNLLFLRMVFAWVDRWLSTRRSRELLTGLIVVFSLGIQWANVTFNPGLAGKQSRALTEARLARVEHAYTVAEPGLRLLPPSLAASAIVHAGAGQALPAAAGLAGVAAFAALWLLVFAWRVRQEFGGENLSEAGPRQPEPAPASPRAAPARAAPALSAASSTRQWLSPQLTAGLGKEWLYTRRNTSQFYALLAPLAMLVLFAARASRFGAQSYLLPAAVAYAMLGTAALAYNAFGLDGTGMQFYLLAPVSFRTVLLGKNMLMAALVALELALVFAIVSYIAGPPDLLLSLAVIGWVVVATAINLMLGNWRSIRSPKKIDTGKVGRNQTSQLSGLIAIGVMLGLDLVAGSLLLLSRHAHLPWLPAAVLLPAAALMAVLYHRSLDRLDAQVLLHRESLLEELTKAS